MIRSGTRCRRAGGIVVGDFLGVHRITNIEHSDSRVEIPARQRRGLFLVVHATVVTTIGEDRQTDKVWQDLSAVSRVVHLECQPRDDFGVGLITDVDDSGHRKWRKACRARALLLGHTTNPSRAALVDKNDIWLPFDLDWNRVLRDGTVFP